MTLHPLRIAALCLGVFCSSVVHAEDLRNLLPSKELNQEGVKISQGPDFITVKTVSGKTLVSARPFSKKQDSGLSIAIEKATDFIEDCSALKVDTVACSKESNDVALVRFLGIPSTDVPAGKTCSASIWAKSSIEGSAAKLYFEGETEGKKHFWRAKDVVLSSKWTKLSFEESLPEDLKALWLRIDCAPGAIFNLTNPQIVLSSSSETPALEQDSTQNLIANGGAERGWYKTGIHSDMELTPVSGTVIAHWGGEGGALLENPFAKWAIDEAVSFSGRHSFKWTHDKPGMTLNALFFNPVPFKTGKPCSFSVMLKGDSKLKGNLAIYMASGIAYTKQVSIDGTWKEYRIDIPEWGKAYPNISKIGDVTSGYGCSLGLVYPSISFEGVGTAWIDNASYMLSTEKASYLSESAWLRGTLDKAQAAYQPEDSVKVSCQAENALGESRDFEVTYELYDYFAKRIGAGTLPAIKLEPKGIKDFEFSFKPNALGPMNLNIKLHDAKSGENTLQSFYFGVYKRAAKLYPWYGLDVNTRSNAAAMSSYIKDFGIGSVRLWSTYKKCVDRYVGFDDVPTYKKAGLYILFNISEFTPFSSGSGASGYATVPIDLNPWATSIGKYAEGCKGLVDSYEITNEPNIWRAPPKVEFDKTKDQFMSPEVYAKAVKAAAESLKAADPSVKISGPATCHTDVVWTSNALAAGAGEVLDIVTEHPYRDKPEAPDYVKDIESMKAVVAKTGRNLPVFASECGYTMPGAPESDTVSDAVRDSVANSLRLQLLAYANGIGKYIHFASTLSTSGTAWSVFYIGNPENNGLSIPNPYLYAIRNMMERLDGAKPIGSCELGLAIRCYVFEREGKRVAAIWKCQDEGKTSSISFKAEGKPFQIFDIMGNELPLEGKGFDKSFDLGGSPIYLESDLDFESISKLLGKADISNVGSPFSVGMTVTGKSSFSIDVSNRTNKAISGSVKILDKNLVAGTQEQEFKDLAAGAKSSLKFESSSPIDCKSKSLKVRSSLEGNEVFQTDDFLLRSMLCSKAAKPIKIDGDLSDWPKNATRISLGYANAYKQAPELWGKEDEKLKANISCVWRDDGLYIAIEVEKPEFICNANSPMELWKCDSLQIAFDPLKNGKVAALGSACYDDDDFEYSVGMLSGKPCVYRHRASSVVYDGLGKNIGLVEGEVDAAIKSEKGRTVYEMRFPASSLSPFRIEKGSSMRWDVIVNLNNGKGRMGWLELTPGIGQSKSPGEFMEMVLTE